VVIVPGIVWINEAGPVNVHFKGLVIVIAALVAVPCRFTHQQGDGNERH
jgi:hypothetical protein